MQNILSLDETILEKLLGTIAWNSGSFPKTRPYSYVRNRQLTFQLKEKRATFGLQRIDCLVTRATFPIFMFQKRALNDRPIVAARARLITR